MLHYIYLGWLVLLFVYLVFDIVSVEFQFIVREFNINCLAKVLMHLEDRSAYNRLVCWDYLGYAGKWAVEAVLIYFFTWDPFQAPAVVLWLLSRGAMVCLWGYIREEAISRATVEPMQTNK